MPVAEPAASIAPEPEPIVPEPKPIEPEAEIGSFGAVAVVPQPGAALARQRMPRNVLRIDRAELDSMHALGMHDALNARLGSVVINDVQNNPLQVDLQYRGFTASPLLGVPQGLAIYQNGVRIHDPLGDVVQWDLVPEHAVQSIELVPGANPLYGQNALGGGLSLRMKDGFSAPGYRIVASAGSFARLNLSGEYGVTWDDWAAYASVSTFDEDGFRDESHSSAQHAYVDLRQRDAKQEVGISLTLAGTDLNGNGLVPIELLRQDRSAVFTFPDNTQNDFLMLVADARRLILEDVWLSGNVHVRDLSRRTLNGDEAELSECMSGLTTIVCDEDDEPLLTETGAEIESPALLGLYDGLYNTTSTASLSLGATAQLSVERELAARPNQLVVGTTFDRASVGFLQRVELGHLTEERGVAGQGVFVGSNEFRTKLDVDSYYAGLYAVDTFTPIDALTLQASGRLNYTHLELIDREGTALNGEHDFLRVNPAVGVTVAVAEPIEVFASYSEGSRAPSAIELSCADPDEPCRLPNAFVADPPLDQVVTRGIELGVRGSHGRTRVQQSTRPKLEWSITGFGSRNFDDIIFVAGSQIGTGYFRNAGQTQRVGLELGASTNVGPIEAYASYTLLRATFETPLVLPAAPNPGVDGGDDEGSEIVVEEGDRMPGIPTQSLKVGVTVHPIAAWAIGASLIAQSDRPFRGDEGNAIDGVNGHAIINASTSYQLFDELQVFVKAENLFDAEYETFGLLADPSEVLENASDPRFLGPGAPLGIWAGVELSGP